MFQPGGVVATGSKSTGWGQFDDGLFSANAVWPAANRAIYISFSIDVFITVFQIGIIVGTQSGSLDVGIYSETNARIVSSGSTAVGVAGPQFIDITDTTLPPGTYWMAMCVDNITAAFNRNTNLEIQTLRVVGIQEQAVGAVTLPDPAVFANPSSAYVPLIALHTKAVA